LCSDFDPNFDPNFAKLEVQSWVFFISWDPNRRRNHDLDPPTLRPNFAHQFTSQLRIVELNMTKPKCEKKQMKKVADAPPPTTTRAPNIEWVKNPDWMWALINYLTDHPIFRKKTLL